MARLVPGLDVDVLLAQRALGLALDAGAILLERPQPQLLRHARRAAGDLRDVDLRLAGVVQVRDLDRHRGRGGHRDDAVLPLDLAEAALAVADVEDVRYLEVVADDQVELAVLVEVAEQDRERLARQAGQLGELLAGELAAVVEDDAAARLLARNAAIPAGRPVADRGVEIAVAVDVAEAQRRGEHRVVAVLHRRHVGDVEHAADVLDQVIALAERRDEQVGPAVIVDVDQRGVEHRHVLDAPDRHLDAA